jgi:hypothetical protein
MQALVTDFEVSEGIYSRACIEDSDSVCLWLGANVMLEYSCEEVYCYQILYVVLVAFSALRMRDISSCLSLWCRPLLFCRRI